MSKSDSDLKITGQRLREAREKAGLTQEQANKIINNNMSVQDIENGNEPIGLSVVGRLATLYGYTLYQIISGESLGPGIQFRIDELRNDIPKYAELAAELLESGKISNGKYEELMIDGGHVDILYGGERLVFNEKDLLSEDPVVVSRAKLFLNNLVFMKKAKENGNDKR